MPKLLTMLIQDVEADFRAIETWVTGTLWPDLKNLGAQIEHDAVAVILPDIQRVAAAIVQDPAMLATPAGWIAAAQSILAVVEADVPRLLEVAGADLWAAVAVALANLQVQGGAAQPAA